MNYIDAHVHVWTDDFEKYPLAEGYCAEDMKPPTFFPEEIIGHGAASGVDRIVLVQMSYYRFDNRYMLDVMREYEGVFSGIAIIDPKAERPDDEMRRLAKEGVRGYRVYEGEPFESWLDGAGYERMLACAADENLAVCPLIAARALPALARRCEQFPDAPIIIDHLCLIGENEPICADQITALCEMAQYPRVMVKVSAFYALGEKKAPYMDLEDMIGQVYRAFGAERLMWASDCPYQVQGGHTYASSVELIEKRLDFIAEEDRGQILRDTAADFFF